MIIPLFLSAHHMNFCLLFDIFFSLTFDALAVCVSSCFRLCCATHIPIVVFFVKYLASFLASEYTGDRLDIFALHFYTTLNER